MLKPSKGFTLVELAVALFVVALFLGGAIGIAAAQRQTQAMAETRRTLHQAREALLGFAAAHGRLPCPATADSAGWEVPEGGTACLSSPGLVPGRSLSLAPLDQQGFLVDAWGNRISYAVSTANDHAYTTAGRMRTRGPSGLTPDLTVTDAQGEMLTDRAVAILRAPGSDNNEQLLWLSPYTLYSRLLSAGGL